MAKTTAERATTRLRTSSRRGTRRDEYNSKPFIMRLEQLLSERNETRREAALRAGLDHQRLGFQMLVFGKQHASHVGRRVASRSFTWLIGRDSCLRDQHDL